MKSAKLLSKSLLHGFLILLSAAVVFSCSNKTDLTAQIPKDASVVMTVDVKGMALKSVDFKNVLSLDNLKKFVGSLGEKTDSAAASIADSGIDFTGKVYVFGQTSEESKYGAVVGYLSDAKKFEAFIKASDKTLTVTEEGKLKFATFSDGKGIVAWNSDEVMIVVGANNPKETVTVLINQKKEESLGATNASFKESQKESADISFWMSVEGITKLAPPSAYSASLGAMNFKDSYLAATCNFEDGEIVLNSKYTTSPEMAEKFNMIKANVNNDVVNILPGKSLIGLIAFAFDMEKIYAHLEKEHLLDAYGPSVTQMTGLTVKELMTMLSGDVAITLNGLEMKEVPYVDYMGNPGVKKEPTPDYSAVFGVANNEKVDQLLAQLIKMGLLTKKDKYYSFQDKVFVFDNGKTLVITGSEARMKAVETGSEKLEGELVTMLGSNASSFYINLANIPEALYAGEGASFGDKIKQSEVQSITITSSAIKDNVSVSKVVVKFKEKKENALVTISRISKKFAESMKQDKEEEEQIPTIEGLNADSTVVN